LQNRPSVSHISMEASTSWTKSSASSIFPETGTGDCPGIKSGNTL